MKSFDYEAVAHDGAVYCCGCAPDVPEGDLTPIFADSEWDSYPVCDTCGAVHDYVSLTPDGQNHEAISSALADYRDGDFDGLVVADLSEVPDDYVGAVLDINDHGNAELYDADCGDFKSIASQV